MNNYLKTSPVRIEPPQLKENDKQYGRILKRLINVTDQLKATRSYLTDKLYPLTGPLPDNVKAESPQEELVPVADELNRVYDDLCDINEDITYVLDRVEL